ncbi:hypothetical protein TPA0598_04_03200 [Streptomyces lydicamycinicus]|uniref:Uncharacterized protein n=1 Tax=Streptomyces lydicamycinicus TaxID=1546107 RepID=A0A0P4R812_9ACTN|nr:hypothetical protein [Streptomyces lydicamycinicus]GAO08684.1 hypothetical protein TPA0598_04_03200 [Streptomyces lydicamycinicus]
MALIQPPLMVNGATHSARVMRMMARNLARASEGVIEGDDLKVRQLVTPSSGVRVGDGAAIITGATSKSQGSYTLFNVGDSTVPIAATGSSARNDLLILRVEDPEYEGTLDPAKDAIGHYEVVPGVSSTQTVVPSGYSAIPLARVNIPANTATITDSMITDLRRIANPRRDRKLYTSFPSSLSELKYQDGKWHTWPTAASWQVSIPVWATSAKVVVTIAGLRMYDNSIWAKMQTVLGSDFGEDTLIDDNQGTSVRRQTVVIADNISISASQRGTTQKLYLQTFMYKQETGNLSVDTGTSIILDVEFSEGLR